MTRNHSIVEHFIKRCVQQQLFDPQTARDVAALAAELDQPEQGGLAGESASLAAPLQPGMALASTSFDQLSELVRSPPDPHMTFENLVPCRANAFPVEVARTVAEQGAVRQTYSPLFVYSEIGLGKTHLLSAIYNHTVLPSPVMINLSDLETEIQRSIVQGYRMELRRYLSLAGILLLDDVQLSEQHELLQRELFSVLNHRIARGYPTVISCDVPPTRLSGIEARLLSRLDSGVIVGLQLAEKAERLEILRRFFGDTKAPEEVLDYLAENVTDNLRRLKAAALQLLAIREHGGIPIDLDVARAVIPHETDLAQPFGQPAPAEAAASQAPSPEVVTARFKEMLASAETPQEQGLALQIALGERLRQLRQERAGFQRIQRFEQALTLLRDGQLQAALSCVGEELGQPEDPPSVEAGE